MDYDFGLASECLIEGMMFSQISKGRSATILSSTQLKIKWKKKN